MSDIFVTLGLVSRRVDTEQLQLDETSPAPEHVNEKAASPRSAADTSSRRSSAAELLATHGALLTRTHLRELGLERRAIDAVFRALPVVALPGYSRPMIRAEQYLELVEEHTYRDDRVRSCHA